MERFFPADTKFSFLMSQKDSSQRPALIRHSVLNRIPQAMGLSRAEHLYEHFQTHQLIDNHRQLHHKLYYSFQDSNRENQETVC